MVPSRAPMTVLQAPSATDSTAIVPSVCIRPAHREGKRGALFMLPFYCIAIPAGIGGSGRPSTLPDIARAISCRSSLSFAQPCPRTGSGPGDQRHEADRHQRVALQPALALHDALDDLGGGIAADRHDQDAADGELVDQRLRAFVGGGGHDDAVERRLARPALAAVADVDTRHCGCGGRAAGARLPSTAACSARSSRRGAPAWPARRPGSPSRCRSRAPSCAGRPAAPRSWRRRPAAG